MGEDSRNAWHVDRRTATFIVLIIIIPAGLIATSYTLTYFDVCLSNPEVSFTLVMSHQGFNESTTQTPPSPVLNVGRCDKVTVHLLNQDTEVHGFAITHYFDSGVKVEPGATHDVIFNANRAGSFVVYCNVLCSIHFFMQDGRLNVR